FFVVFFFFGMRTPKVLEDGAVAQERRKTDELRVQIDNKEKELAALSKAKREEYEVNATQIQELKQEIKRQRNSDPKRNAIRNQFEKYLARFESLKERIAQGDKGAGTELDNLDHEAHTYIKEHFPQDIQFVADCPITFRYSHANHVDLNEAQLRC